MKQDPSIEISRASGRARYTLLNGGRKGKKDGKNVARGAEVGEEGPRHDGRGPEAGAAARRVPCQAPWRTQQLLQVAGARCRVYRDDGLYQAAQDQQGLIPWNGKQDILIDRPRSTQLPVSKGSYSQVGFSYKGEDHEESHNLDSESEDEDDDEDDDEKDFSSDDSHDERMETIAKEFGIKRYKWLVYMDKKAKEEEKRQKEIIRGDPAIRKLSRKERRKASQMEREKEREAARLTGRAPHHDPYRSRSRSWSFSPSHSRWHDHSSHADNGHRSKSKLPKIEYITEFGGTNDLDKKFGVSPPSSPLPADLLNRASGGRILEALHVDPASAMSLEQEKNAKMLRPPISSPSSSSAIAKLSKTPLGTSSKTPQGEKKETPQECLKRIMSKQLNKQIQKDTAAEMAKKREQERHRQEKLAEARRINRYSHRNRSRSYSPSPTRSRSRTRCRINYCLASFSTSVPAL
ncbi:splicing factor, arginine serine-rich 16, partial [Musa troglodytarum]